MMPPLSTPVDCKPFPFQLDMESTMVSIGSCFADELGKRLMAGGIQVNQNPFGTLYNPASIATAIERILDDRPIDAQDLVYHEGLWHSWHHHGSFSRPEADQTLALCNERIHQAHNDLTKSTLLTVTFGTAWVFELASPSQNVATKVVANCHKLPASTFVRRRMSVAEIVSLWIPLIQKITTLNRHINILFTVSPIRHMADGAHGNQLSKSTLLLAIDTLLNTPALSDKTFYFPAYEIVLDELRDYRFYNQDMSHPSPLAVDIVWDRFQKASMSPNTIQQIQINTKHAKQLQHIPLHRSNA